MIPSNGTNQYPNNQFSFWEWSAPVLQTPEEVLAKLNELHLEGRIIKDIIAIGMGYGWTDDSICDMAYNAREQLHPFLQKRVSEAEALFSSEIELGCSTTIDEPLLIVFEDGDVLGISLDEGSSARMELNTIPTTIEPGINYKNFHANILFQDLIGKTISDAWVNATSKEPIFTWSHGMDLDEQPMYINEIVLLCRDNEKPWLSRTLCFRAWVDYGTVELCDQWGEAVTIPITQVPQIVEGYPAADLFQNTSEGDVKFLKRISKWFKKHS